MVDRYTKIVLTVIALALVALAIGPRLEPKPAGAQPGHYSYSVTFTGGVQPIKVELTK